MKKIISISFILIFILQFTSCSISTSLKVDKIKTLELSYPQVDEYHLFGVGMINDNSPIMILGNGKEDNLKKIYRLNLKDKTNKIIYEGEGRGSFFAIYIKDHPNGTYSIQFEDENALIFDDKTDQLIKTIDFNKVEGTFFSISNNGEKVVYSSIKGLCVSDLDFQNEAIIYTPIDISASARWPSFSNDDSKIAFSIGEPITMQKCLYNFSTDETITINYNSYYTFWPKNFDGFIACDDGFVTDTPNNPNTNFKCFDFNGNEINSIKIDKIIFPIRSMQDYVAYYYDMQTIQGLTETGFRDCKIMLWDFKNNVLRELDIGYQIQEIWSYQASKEGNKLLMFMTVVIDGEAIPKVLWVDIDGKG